MTPLAVSVCIPTCKRHDLLVECIESVFASTVRPLEIVVSDDADEPELEARLEALPCPLGVTLRYVVNPTDHGEAGNARNALEHASHEIVVLMHDDDFFLPGGLDALWRAWQEAGDGVDAVYGRQRVVTAAGVDQPKLTLEHNRKYCRVDPGPVPSRLWAALMLQFPMNGMMLRRSVALSAGVPREREVGGNTDLQFGVLYALAATRPYRLIDEDVSVYRLSVDSKQRPTTHLRLDGHLTYRTLEALRPATEIEHQAQRHALDRAAGDAVLAHVARGETDRARALFAAHWSRMKIPWQTRLKLVVIIAGTVLGLGWPAESLRRRRLGLPAWRRPAIRQRTSDDTGA